MDIDNQFVYWSDTGTNQILRGNKDGGGTADELFSLNDYPTSVSDGNPSGLAIDESFVYWGDATNQTILRGPKDGSGTVSEIFSARGPNDLAVDETFVYWTDYELDSIYRSNKDGSGGTTILFTKNDYPVVFPAAIPAGIDVDDT